MKRKPRESERWDGGIVCGTALLKPPSKGVSGKRHPARLADQLEAALLELDGSTNPTETRAALAVLAIIKARITSIEDRWNAKLVGTEMRA